MGSKAINPNRLKYKVFFVYNVNTNEATRLAGMGMDLPYEPLRNMSLGEVWRVTDTASTNLMSYERIL